MSLDLVSGGDKPSRLMSVLQHFLYHVKSRKANRCRCQQRSSSIYFHVRQRCLFLITSGHRWSEKLVSIEMFKSEWSSCFQQNVKELPLNWSSLILTSYWKQSHVPMDCLKIAPDAFNFEEHYCVLLVKIIIG